MLLFERGAIERLKQTENRRKLIKYPWGTQHKGIQGRKFKETLIF